MKCPMCGKEFNSDHDETTMQVIIRFRHQSNEELFICSRCTPILKGHVGSFRPDMITDRSKKQHYHAKEKREKFTEDMHEFYDHYHSIVDKGLPKIIEAVELVMSPTLGVALRKILDLVKKMFDALYCYDQSRTKDCPCCGIDTPGWIYSDYYEKPEE